MTDPFTLPELGPPQLLPVQQEEGINLGLALPIITLPETIGLLPILT
jgi:hypothetical protein